jgi:hypothetical protein
MIAFMIATAVLWTAYRLAERKVHPNLVEWVSVGVFIFMGVTQHWFWFWVTLIAAVKWKPMRSIARNSGNYPF